MKTYLLTYKFQNLFLVSLLALKSACLVGASLTLSFLTNALVQQSFKDFLFWLLADLAFYLVYLLLAYYTSVLEAKLIQKMSLDLRKSYIQNSLNADFTTFQKRDTGEHLAILNNDIKLIEDNGFSSFYNLLSTIFTTSFSIIALLSFDLRIVLLTIFLTLLVTYLPSLFSKKAESYMKQFSQANETLLAGFNDYLSGYQDLYYANRKGILLEKIRAVNKVFVKEKISFIKKNSLIEIAMTFFSVTGQIGVLLLTGFLITAGQISIGTISSVGQISGNIFHSLTTLNQLQVAMSSVQPLFLKMEASNPAQGKDFPEEIQNVQLSHLTYAFGDKTIFSDLNIDLKKGAKYAIIGESGCGKSTLIQLLLGNGHVYTGHVSFNQTELMDIRKDQLIEKIRYIGNHTHIFNDSLRHNINLWNQEISEEKILQVLKRVNLDELVHRLDESISPDTLSEGQKQRIGLARAFLQEPNFIITDEATANLDKANAERIEEGLLTDPNLTYITVTHHLNQESMGKFDQIIDLNKK